MAIVIRTAWNNQGFTKPCIFPGKDQKCWKCFKETLNIQNRPKRDDAICPSSCWEASLAVNFQWGNPIKGNKFGREAQAGHTALFVYQQCDGNYTIWGKSKITESNVPCIKSTETPESGYTFWMRFEAFEPFKEEEQIKNISVIDLVGAPWSQGGYRYISEERVSRLLSPIAKTSESRVIMPTNETSSVTEGALHVSLPQIQIRKLEKISNEEGRSIDDIVRQAVAELIRRYDSL